MVGLLGMLLGPAHEVCSGVCVCVCVCVCIGEGGRRGNGEILKGA